MRLMPLCVALAACPAPTRMMTVPEPPDVAQNVRAFDLVPRGWDDNGFALNPRLGWDFNAACARGDRADWNRDPRACSWSFVTADDTAVPRRGRRPCTTLLMDPDLATDFSVGGLAMLCSDSPLSFTGHINWGQFYGGAVTYDGLLDWTEFSGYWPNDHDLNFELSLDRNRRLSETTEKLGVELDAKELRDLRSPWWRKFVETASTGTPARSDVVRLLGEQVEAQVTGLLGIDAEHMTTGDMHLELHPAYAMALSVPCEGCGRGPVEDWALLLRTTGNEGLCSNWDRKHSMPVLGGLHVFRLPWMPGKGNVAVDPCRSVLCGKGEAAGTVRIRHSAINQVLLVEVPLRVGDTVDGELVLDWFDGQRPPPPQCAERAIPDCHRLPIAEETLDGELSELPEPSACAAEIDPPMSPARRAILRPGAAATARRDLAGTARRRAAWRQ